MNAFVIIICAVAAFIGIIYYVDYKDRKRREKSVIQIHKPEELVEVFVRWIADDYWDWNRGEDYLDFTKKEVRKFIPCWHERKRFLNLADEGEGSFWLGEDDEGNDWTYIVHFTQEDWARFSQLYDRHRKESDDWSDWWGERWENLFASIVANQEVMRRVYDWCHKSEGKRKKAASTYLKEVLDLMRKNETCPEPLRISRGKQADITQVETRLLEMGFRRTDYVAVPGQFAIRGSILDVFADGETYPFRIDFFGNEVDSLRTFDPQSQQTKERREQCCISAKGEESRSDGGEYTIHHCREWQSEFVEKRLTTAEDMAKFMLEFFEPGFWQSGEMQEELSKNYREVLTDYFDNIREYYPDMVLALSDAEWKRLKRLFPQLIEEDEMRDIIKDTLEVRIGHVIDQKVGRSAQAIIVHDMLEPFA